MRTRTQTLFLLLLACVVVVLYAYKMMLSPQTTNLIVEMKMEKRNESLNHIGNAVLKVMERLKKEGKPVLVTVINDAYVPFAHNWLCNTINMGIHEQVLVILTDTKSRDEITQRWPGILAIGLSDKEEFHGDQDYSHAGYVRIMIRRTELLLDILKQKVDVLMFDLDTFWLTNPIPKCQKQIEGYDIAAIPVSDRKNVICGGFLYMKPTDNMIKLWEKLTEKMRDLGKKIKNLDEKKSISEGDNDQVYISDLLARKYAGIRMKELTLKDFPDGKWYNLKDSDKQKLKPLVIHNNWIIGNKAKISRAQKFRQWFWDSKTGKCNTDLVILATHS